ncbi:MAG: hypothetical protein PW844_21500, partial [Pantoea sp.]|nr:hypothetical protein [Pantoea sp.]
PWVELSQKDCLMQVILSAHGVARSGVKVEGVSAVDTPELAMQGDVTLTLLSDDAAIREILIQNDLLSKTNPTLVHVVVSTISIVLAQT